MSDMLGRPLATAELVHHINRNPLDNRAENLMLVSRAEHCHLHQPEIQRR